MEMRLPLYIIHAVTTAILSNLSTNELDFQFIFYVFVLKMSIFSVVIIDSYPLPSYISSSSTSLNPPIRFLCTSKASKNVSSFDSKTNTKLKAFYNIVVAWNRTSFATEYNPISCRFLPFNPRIPLTCNISDSPTASVGLYISTCST